MNSELSKQERYWDREVKGFDAIYSGEKGKLGRFLDGLFRWDMYARFDYTMKNSEPIAGRTFLDVGCGTGRYALALADRQAQRVLGIDIAEQMVQVSQERAAAVELADRCEFLKTDLLEYEPEDKFDVAIGIGLFDYIRDAVPVLAKMRECVNDRVVVSFPRFWTWRAPLRKIRLALRKCRVYFFTRSRVEKLLEEAGFSRFNIEKIGKLFCVTAFVDS